MKPEFPIPLIPDEEHISDIILWLSSTYPDDFHKWTEEERNQLIDLIYRNVFATYPNFKDFTMFEILELYQTELESALEELI